MNSINEHVTDGSSLYCKSIYQPDKSKLLLVRGLGFHPESRQMERVRFLITTSEGRLNCLLSPRWLCFLQFVCWCLWFRIDCRWCTRAHSKHTWKAIRRSTVQISSDSWRGEDDPPKKQKKKEKKKRQLKKGGHIAQKANHPLLSLGKHAIFHSLDRFARAARAARTMTQSVNK